MEFLGQIQLKNYLFALLLLVLGYIAARFASRSLQRILQERLTAHQTILTRRLVFYGIFFLFFLSSLNQLGMSLGVLLGAAGIISVALGFAAQTSASNMISGLFMLGERAFSIGDLIRVGNTTGEVISIDLLSVKLRTFDNLYVRMPNETIIKSELVNMSKHDIRRIDLQLGVAYKEDLERVRTVLNQVVHDHSKCLEEPEPLIIITGFADSAITMQFSFYAERDNFLTVRNEMYEQIKRAFDESDIEIPFPHRTLYAGSATKPLPVHVLGSREESAEP